MRYLSFLILNCFIAITAHGKTLVIADIDDTLRLTNRVYGSYTEQLNNIVNLEMPFSGMKELMQVFDAQDAKIYYLTAAIKPLDKVSEAFLAHNDFPQKFRFINKEWWQETEDYKVGEILRLIKKEDPDTIILIGDNGEKDPLAYARVQEIYPSTHVFIHFLYNHGSSVPVPSQQTAYITSAEIAAQLEHRLVLNPKLSEYVMDVVWRDLNKSLFAKSLVLPEWSDITTNDVISLYSYPYLISDGSNEYLRDIKKNLIETLH